MKPKPPQSAPFVFNDQPRVTVGDVSHYHRIGLFGVPFVLDMLAALDTSEAHRLCEADLKRLILLEVTEYAGKPRKVVIAKLLDMLYKKERERTMARIDIAIKEHRRYAGVYDEFMEKAKEYAGKRDRSQAG